ncbi:MAG: UDP-N-acetylglucosamine 2-epimerase (non-hydrolyzing) [Proteobacteria bacterium]|nr:UDP-N-acetylglucosamine 2-epimerase (non-hydrolyzing) [Pseudomonadota bacterium]
MKKIVHLVVAARPNFMKIAPLHKALSASGWCEPVLVHTGQHYDTNLSDVFFADLGLPQPAANLGVGSGTHAEQTAAVMVAYEKFCLARRPDWVVVPGDVNSTLACALAAVKLGIPIAHLEAGLRSGDRRMPEEINRVVTDSLASLLWTPSSDADANLLREGVPAGRIELVGNIMIDSFEMLRTRIESSNILTRLDLGSKPYAVATFHRPSNVDMAQSLGALIDALAATAAALPVVFPVHPRTRARIADLGLAGRLSNGPVRMIDPLGYVDFMKLVSSATIVVTDSGGIQEETTYLRVPCVTIRETTERPVTTTLGTNVLAGLADLPALRDRAMAGRWKESGIPPLWDGQTAARAVESLRRHAG